jgi:glycosyltransferase involved in cell wall biosynthesis
MNHTPFFSVVIPTYNRANLLKYGIQTVLEQKFGDFEIVVSDNCSSDNTEEIVKNLNDPRIKYFKTEKNIPMLENWRYA